MKRAFDIVFSALGMIVLAPIGVVIALLVKLSDGGPVLYGQTRVGQFGVPFRIWKFRSMVVNADKLGAEVTKDHDPRITPVGRFLRKTKLDELPQLWNVFVGDMSFVGPRPEVPRYVERYTAEQEKILKFKPGITDVATMLFRNEEALLAGADNVEEFYIRHCLPRKIELNLEYSQRANVLRDLWIIIQTLCPYWIGVLAIYAVALTAAFFVSSLLQSDFSFTASTLSEFGWHLPWIVFPQLILLFWRGQVRGLISYFSVPEFRRTATALSIALVLQFGLVHFSEGRLDVRPSLLLINFMMSFFAICGVRLGFRFLREHSGRTAAPATTGPERRMWRVAIVGTGQLATNIALDFARTRNGARKVVAFFDDDPHTWRTRPHDIPVIGMPECLLNAAWKDSVDEVVIALPEEQHERVEELRELLRELPVKITVATDWPVLT